MSSEKDLLSFIMTSEKESFAWKTIVHRKPKIIEEVIRDNTYPRPTVEHLLRLREEILGGTVQPLAAHASDVEQWNAVCREFEDKT